MQIFEVVHKNHPAMLIEANSPEEAETLFLKEMGIISTDHRPRVSPATDEQIQALEEDQKAAKAEAEAELEKLPDGKILGKTTKVQEVNEEAEEVETSGKKLRAKK